MKLSCIRCSRPFEHATIRGYCDPCLEAFSKQREKIHAAQRPGPGIFVDGKFANESPQSMEDPIAGARICSICGSTDIEQGYGLGSGYGMGSYTFCNNCYAFLDFHEDIDL